MDRTDLPNSDHLLELPEVMPPKRDDPAKKEEEEDVAADLPVIEAGNGLKSSAKIDELCVSAASPSLLIKAPSLIHSTLAVTQAAIPQALPEDSEIARVQPVYRVSRRYRAPSQGGRHQVCPI